MRKVVLVTGSSIGIGSSIIKEFAKNNYNVVINYNNNGKSAFDLKKHVEENYNIEALVIKCDISNEIEVKNMIDEILNKFNKIDVLVNNASIENTSDLCDKNFNTFSKVINVNLIGTFLVSKYAGSIMLKNKYGKIINVSSNNAIDKYDPSTIEYDASKAGIISLTHNFAKAYAPYINVNCIAPGWIETENVKNLDKSLDGKLISDESKKILLNRFGLPDEVAKLVYFLSSDDASYINNEIIRIDGGC